MKKILESASRLWMLLGVLFMSIAFMAVVIYNITSDSVVVAVVSMFWSFMSWITVYYYTRKSTDTQTYSWGVQAKTFTLEVKPTDQI